MISVKSLMLCFSTDSDLATATRVSSLSSCYKHRRVTVLLPTTPHTAISLPCRTATAMIRYPKNKKTLTIGNGSGCLKPQPIAPSICDLRSGWSCTWCWTTPVPIKPFLSTDSCSAIRACICTSRPHPRRSSTKWSRPRNKVCRAFLSRNRSG